MNLLIRATNHFLYIGIILQVSLGLFKYGPGWYAGIYNPCNYALEQHSPSGKIGFWARVLSNLEQQKTGWKAATTRVWALKRDVAGLLLVVYPSPSKTWFSFSELQISTSVRHVWMHSPLPNFHNFAVQSEDAVRTYLSATHRNANACSRLGLNDQHPKTCCTIQASTVTNPNTAAAQGFGSRLWTYSLDIPRLYAKSAPVRQVLAYSVDMCRHVPCRICNVSMEDLLHEAGNSRNVRNEINCIPNGSKWPSSRPVSIRWNPLSAALFFSLQVAPAAEKTLQNEHKPGKSGAKVV